MQIIHWIKNHKLVVLLLLIIGYLLVSQDKGYLRQTSLMQTNGILRNADRGPLDGVEEMNLGIVPEPVDGEPPPFAGNDRLVIETSSLSLLVKNVVEVRSQIVSFVEGKGGYMVNSTISNPQDAPTATVTVRIPNEQLREALDFFRSLSIKVVSENLTGRDVTDKYVDIDKRIALLEKTKTRFEAILEAAQEISDITSLNQQIIAIQGQIDSLRGQQLSLSQNAQLSKVTIYLSTDEIALPYAPSETFRPSVIFKLAVRSLIGHIRQLATLLIWLGVYAVVWVPVTVLVYWWRRKHQKTR